MHLFHDLVSSSFPSTTQLVNTSLCININPLKSCSPSKIITKLITVTRTSTSYKIPATVTTKVGNTFYTYDEDEFESATKSRLNAVIKLDGLDSQNMPYMTPTSTSIPQDQYSAPWALTTTSVILSSLKGAPVQIFTVSHIQGEVYSDPTSSAVTSVPTSPRWVPRQVPQRVEQVADVILKKVGRFFWWWWSWMDVSDLGRVRALSVLCSVFQSGSVYLDMDEWIM